MLVPAGIQRRHFGERNGIAALRNTRDLELYQIMADSACEGGFCDQLCKINGHCSTWLTRQDQLIGIAWAALNHICRSPGFTQQQRWRVIIRDRHQNALGKGFVKGRKFESIGNSNLAGPL